MQKGRFYLVKGLSLLGKRGAFALRFGGDCGGFLAILQNKIKRWLGMMLVFSELEGALNSLKIWLGDGGVREFSILVALD